MSKKRLLRKLFFLGIILATFYCIYNFFAVFMLTNFANKKKDHIKKYEEIFFNELKQKYKFTKISRAPEYNFEKPQDTCTYELYFENFDCNKPKQELKNISKEIFNGIERKLKLGKLYYKYKIVYYCIDKPPRIEFNHIRYN